MHSHSHISINSPFQQYFLTFLVGMVMANLIFHIGPEILEAAIFNNLLIISSLIVVLGIFTQYALHRFLHPVKKSSHQFLAALHFHNITDGITIGLGFLVSPQFGLAALAAIIAHDSIHKIIAFNFLTKEGDNKKVAIKKILLTFFTIAAGAFITIITQPTEIITILGGSFAGGSLLYVAWILLKEIFSQHQGNKIFIKLCYFLLGLILMYSFMLGLEQLFVN